MKKLLILLAFLIPVNLYAEGVVYKFAVAPNNRNPKASLEVFLGYLSEKTGEKFELVQLPLEEIIAKFGTGEVSFAELSSSYYTSATKALGSKIKYIATIASRNDKGELVPYYKGYFYTLKSSPYNSIADLKGKSFGFVNKGSSSGYIYPLSVMTGMGIDPESFFGTVTFTEDHAKIFEGIKSGFLDAGVSNYDSCEKATALYGDIFKIIGETAEIPSGAIIASSSVNPELVKKVEKTLLAIKPTDPAVSYPGFVYKGFIKKSGGFYDFIRNIINKFRS